MCVSERANSRFYCFKPKGFVSTLEILLHPIDGQGVRLIPPLIPSNPAIEHYPRSVNFICSQNSRCSGSSANVNSTCCGVRAHENLPYWGRLTDENPLYCEREQGPAAPGT